VRAMGHSSPDLVGGGTEEIACASTDLSPGPNLCSGAGQRSISAGRLADRTEICVDTERALPAIGGATVATMANETAASSPLILITMIVPLMRTATPASA